MDGRVRLQGNCRSGSLGEAPTLTREEKVEILKQARRSLGDQAPVIAGVAALSTADAVWLAKEAYRAGVDGLMVLPPQVYRSDWRETQAHLDAIFQATPLSCMLYNKSHCVWNGYHPGTDNRIAVRHGNFHAVKESSGDIRRITSLKHLGSLAVFVGMDDVVVESVAAGAIGWVAGLVNAFPEESVRLFSWRRAVHRRSWIPSIAGSCLVRLDTVPKFVQLIKQVQEECGGPSARVRPPRLELAGAERDDVLALTRRSLANCPR